MKTLKQKIEVMQAADRGEMIECISLVPCPGEIWLPQKHPDFNWVEKDYRVRLEPREWWLIINPDTLVNSVHNSFYQAEKRNKHFNEGVGVEIVHVREVNDT